MCHILALGNPGRAKQPILRDTLTLITIAKQYDKDSAKPGSKHDHAGFNMTSLTCCLFMILMISGSSARKIFRTRPARVGKQGR